MANLSREQEQIQRVHNAHQSKYVRFNPDCPECVRQRNWQPPTTACNFCDTRLQIGDQAQAIAHNEYHMKNPTSITK